MLHHIVTGHEMNELGAQFLCKGPQKLNLPVHIAAVADDAPQAHTALGRIAGNALGNIVGSVKGHHLAAGHNVDFLGLALADRHGETAADHIPQHIVKDIIQVIGIGSQALQEADGSDDAASGAAHPRLRAAGLHATGAAKARLQDAVQLHLVTLVPQGVQHGLLGQPPQEQAGGIRLGVAAHHHDILSQLRKACGKILGSGGLANAALAIYCNLS